MRLSRIAFILTLLAGVAIPQLPLVGLAASAAESLRAPQPGIEQCEPRAGHRHPA